MTSIDIDVIDARGGDDAPTPTAIAASGLVVAQQPATISNLAFSNQVAGADLAAKAQAAHQDAMNRLRQSILARATASLNRASPATARPAVHAITGESAAQQLAELQAALRVAASQAPKPSASPASVPVPAPTPKPEAP